MKVKQWVFDRIEQSVELFKNNFKNIFLSYFLYKFLVFLVWSFIYYLALNIIDFDSILGDKWEWLNSIWELFWNTVFLIWVNVFIILVVINLILIVPFILAVIKTVKDSYEEKENIDFVENIKYGFKELYNSFKTYWYIFAYIALIPAFFIILWWLFLIFGQVQNLDSILQTWLWIFWFWFILLIIFSVYRWIKSTFSIFSAVDKNEYTKENFKKSVEVTDNNWWRIVWNFFLIWILISIIWWIINSIIWVVQISTSGIFDLLNMKDLSSIQNWGFSPERIWELVKQYTWEIWSFSILWFIIDIIKLIIENIFAIFTFIFTYLFYKRLEFEKYWIKKENNYEDLEILDESKL